MEKDTSGYGCYLVTGEFLPHGGRVHSFRFVVVTKHAATALEGAQGALEAADEGHRPGVIRKAEIEALGLFGVRG